MYQKSEDTAKTQLLSKSAVPFVLKCIRLFMKYFLHVEKKLLQVFYEVCIQLVMGYRHFPHFFINLLILDSNHAFWLTLALPSSNLHEYT